MSNPLMIAGDKTMPSTNDGSYEEGHSGNGALKLTKLNTIEVFICTQHKIIQINIKKSFLFIFILRKK